MGHRREKIKKLGDAFGGDFFGYEGFDYVADFNVAVVGDGDAAFHAGADFGGIVFEAAERGDFAFEDDDIVAEEADFGVALDVAVGDAAAGDGADLGDAESFEYVGAALVNLFDGGLEEAGHGALHLVLQFVNDGVETDVDFFLVGEFLRFALGANVEADDDGVGRGGEEHVGFGDGADAGAEELEANFVVGEAAE